MVCSTYAQVKISKQAKFARLSKRFYRGSFLNKDNRVALSFS